MSSATDPLVIPGYRPGTWSVDRRRSRIDFSIRQLIGKVRGRFTEYDVTIVTREPLTASSVDVVLDLASIDTGNDKRDSHLRGADLLQVDEHPGVRYGSSGVQRVDSDLVVNGRLTIHGVTRTVPLELEVKEFGADPSGAIRAVFVVSAQISRRAFGVIIRMDGGGAVISDKVAVRAEICALLQD